MSKPPTLDQLEKSGIKFVRFQWNDLTNLTRFRVIPFKFFCKMVKEAEKQQRAPFVAVTQASLGIVILALAKGFIASGEWAYVADMSSLRICGYAPGHASVMGFFQTKDPSPGASLDVPLCPRSALYRAVECVTSPFVLQTSLIRARLPDQPREITESLSESDSKPNLYFSNRRYRLKKVTGMGGVNHRRCPPALPSPSHWKKWH
jgi:hypothetical protein